MKLLLVLMLLLAAAAPAMAGEAQPLSRNVAAEQRLIDVTKNLRCLVCQNESLAASQADLARDLRAEVRGLIARGYTNKQIVDYLVVRYGNYVRYSPPFDAETWALWLGPFALLAFGLAALALIIRRRARRADTPLDAAQLERARALLAQTGEHE